MWKAWLLCMVGAAASGCEETGAETDCAAKATFDQPTAATSLLSSTANIRKVSKQLGMKSTLQALKLTGKLASLLEDNSVLLGSAGVDITPGVKETLGELIETIDNSILGNIRSHHEATQQRVRSKVSELRQTTNFAVGAHTEAKYADIDYVQCMRDLKSCHASHATCTQELGELKTTAKESCRISRGKRFYKSYESVHAQSIPVLECDYALPKSECKFDDFAIALENWKNTIKSELDTNRSNYDAAQEICDQDQKNVDDKIQNCNETQNKCVADALNCADLKTRRDVSICTFSDRLQEKCASKASYDDLAANVLGTENVDSEPDRRYEWASAELLKCMLQDHRNGADFDKETMQKCEPLSDYSRDVGQIDLKADDVRRLTSGENFDCIETDVTFSGVNVVVEPGTPYPTIRFDTPFAHTMSLSLGTAALGICSTSQD
jgi:hypothetical protein